MPEDPGLLEFALAAARARGGNLSTRPACGRSAFGGSSDLVIRSDDQRGSSGGQVDLRFPRSTTPLSSADTNPVDVDGAFCDHSTDCVSQLISDH